MSINLEVLLDRVGARLGVGSDVGSKLPADKRKLELLRSNQLKLAQDGVKVMKGLAFILPLLVILMYLGALALGAGDRRRVLLEIGVGIIAGALVWRWCCVAGSTPTWSTTSSRTKACARPRAKCLDIATAGWRSRALWLLITGVVVIFAGWLAGPMRWARRLRELIAEPLEHHPGWFATGAAAIVLLIATLGPERTPGQALPLLIELVLVVVGVLALRRQIEQERGEAAGPPTLVHPPPTEAG